MLENLAGKQAASFLDCLSSNRLLQAVDASLVCRAVGGLIKGLAPVSPCSTSVLDRLLHYGAPNKKVAEKHGGTYRT